MDYSLTQFAIDKREEIEKKNNDLDDLKKSLLQKAFAGELTQTKVTA